MKVLVLLCSTGEVVGGGKVGRIPAFSQTRDGPTVMGRKSA